MRSFIFVCRPSSLHFEALKRKKRPCSKLEISVTEHLVEVVDKLSTTAVVFLRCSLLHL